MTETLSPQPNTCGRLKTDGKTYCTQGPGCSLPHAQTLPPAPSPALLARPRPVLRPESVVVTPGTIHFVSLLHDTDEEDAKNLVLDLLDAASTHPLPPVETRRKKKGGVMRTRRYVVGDTCVDLTEDLAHLVSLSPLWEQEDFAYAQAHPVPLDLVSLGITHNAAAQAAEALGLPEYHKGDKRAKEAIIDALGDLLESHEGETPEGYVASTGNTIRRYQVYDKTIGIGAGNRVVVYVRACE